jgi:hypothetical protein
VFKKIRALFGSRANETEAVGGGVSEHAVLVEFEYGQEDLDDLYEAEERLREVVEAAGAGECDGHEIAMDGSHGQLFLYGPDADALFSVAKPVILASDCLKKPQVTLRYGRADDKNARQYVVDLTSH